MSTKDDREKQAKGVVGVWQVKEIARQGGSSPIIDRPLPSIIIFTPSHYSMVWVFDTDPPRSFAEQWSPTDAEKIERFDSLVVNSGTYEVEGNVLTAQPVVARIPEFVGGTLTCEYHIENDVMELKFIDEYSYDGVQAPWVVKGGLILTLTRMR